MDENNHEQNIFISYVGEELEHFCIPEIARDLEKHPKIGRVYYWHRDNTADQTIIKYMQDSIQKSSIILSFCSKKALESGPVEQEMEMGVMLNRKFIPIYDELRNVPLILRPKRCIEFRPDEPKQIKNEIIAVLGLSVLERKHDNDVEEKSISSELSSEGASVTETIDLNADKIHVLDAFLQFSMNPSSKSALKKFSVLGPNYWLIGENLHKIYDLTVEEIKQTIELLRKKTLNVSYSTYYPLQKEIREHISNRYKVKFLDLISKYNDDDHKSEMQFLWLLKHYLPEDGGLNSGAIADYNAMFPHDLQYEKLIEIGVIKRLWWQHSTKKNDNHAMFLYIPFLTEILDSMDISKYAPEKPNVEQIIERIYDERKVTYIEFFENRVYRNSNRACYDPQLYTQLKIIPGFLGKGELRDSCVSINPLIWDEFFNIIFQKIMREDKELHEKLIAVLKIEQKTGQYPELRNIIRDLGVDVKTGKTLDRKLKENPRSISYLIENDPWKEKIHDYADEAIAGKGRITLLNLMEKHGYPIEIAKAVGSLLMQEEIIVDFKRY